MFVNSIWSDSGYLDSYCYIHGTYSLNWASHHIKVTHTCKTLTNCRLSKHFDLKWIHLVAHENSTALVRIGFAYLQRKGRSHFVYGTSLPVWIKRRWHLTF